MLTRIALLGLFCAVSGMAQNDLAFISRPCPSNITTPQLHAVFPITVTTITIPFVVCIGLGPGFSIDRSSSVPTLVFSGVGAGTVLPLIVQVEGLTVGMASTLNLKAGTGTTVTCSPRTGNIVDCSESFNSAVVPTIDQEHDNLNYCRSSNGTPAFTCALPARALTAYRRGQSFMMDVDAVCTPGCTLAINGLAPISIKKVDGSEPNQNLTAKWILFDGTVFRVP